MKYVMLSCALIFATTATAALAEEPGMDMSKMGPWTRKPTDEKKIKAEVAAFFKAEEELAKKGGMSRADLKKLLRAEEGLEELDDYN